MNRRSFLASLAALPFLRRRGAEANELADIGDGVAASLRQEVASAEALGGVMMDPELTCATLRCAGPFMDRHVTPFYFPSKRVRFYGPISVVGEDGPETIRMCLGDTADWE